MEVRFPPQLHQEYRRVILEQPALFHLTVPAVYRFIFLSLQNRVKTKNLRIISLGIFTRSANQNIREYKIAAIRQY
jgi:hypothetical protein